MTSACQLSTLHDLQVNWWGPPPGYPGGAREFRKAILAHLTSPTHRGFFCLCRRAVVESDRKALQQWLSGRNQQREKILRYGDQGNHGEFRTLYGVFRGHLWCALACLQAGGSHQRGKTGRSVTAMLSSRRAFGKAEAKRLVKTAFEALLSVEEAWAPHSLRRPPFDVQEIAGLLLQSNRLDQRAVEPAQRLDAAFLLLGEQSPDWKLRSVPFLRDLAQQLLGTGSERRKCDWEVKEPFALVSAEMPDVARASPGPPEQIKGVLGQFVLQRLPGGVGALFPAPEHAFLRLQHQFSSLFQDLSRSLCSLVETAKNYDLRVKLEFLESSQHRSSRFIEVPLKGRSTSGAAARGAYFAFSGKVPDKGMIVLAQANADGTLGKVNHVAVKVQAIAAHGGFDTIVVTAANVNEATETLRDYGEVWAEPCEARKGCSLYVVRFRKGKGNVRKRASSLSGSATRPAP